MSCEPHDFSMSDAITHEVGNSAPAFECLDSSGNVHSSAAYQADGKTVILYFYPRDSTPGCTTQACDFRDNFARLTTEGFIVLGVSKDSEGSHEKFLSLIHI